MLRTSVIFLLSGAGLLCAADKPNREIQELQRDVAQLQEMIRTLQSGVEQRVAGATTQMQAMTQSMDKLNATVAGVQKGLEQLAQDQDRKIVPLVASQGSRVEQMTGTLSTMQQAVADLTAALNRLETQMVDVGNAVKVMQMAAPKPPSAEDLLKSAESDRLGGKFDLALQEYADYVKQYGDTPMADTAQFQVGMLHYAAKDMEAAVKDFETLAGKYPGSKKLPEALFYKSKSLQALDRAADARAACLELRKRFATNDFARQCAVARQ
jgi:TolA-binding protein